VSAGSSAGEIRGRVGFVYVHTIEHDGVQVHIESAGRAVSLHNRHRAATAAVSRKALTPGAASLEGEDRPDERADQNPNFRRAYW
jgi:hypothetical protein